MGEKYFAQPSAQSSQHNFSQVPSSEIQRSKFDRSHGHKTTCDAGELIPVYVDEVLPGDTFHMSSTAFGRMSTPLKPIMDNIYLDTHYFFVPYRLVWDNWERFMGERKTPTDDPDQFVVPKAEGLNPSTLPIYTVVSRMAMPARAGIAQGGRVSALPLRAYALIWDEWYRDQNIQTPVFPGSGDGPDVNFWQTFACMKRNKRHDYFTSCLPWPQKGDPVLLPLGGVAAVVGNYAVPELYDPISATQRKMQLSNITGTHNAVGYSGSLVTPAQDTLWVTTGMMADLSTATAVTINDLRTAFQIQRLLERDARGGTRYIELILSHFGVRSDDARLQRPEYLGGGTAMVNINPIAATAPLPDAPQGNLAAYATVLGKGNFTKSFTEHGVVIGLMSFRADLTYQQGIERMWKRTTRYDFYWPSLANLGEQAVYNYELYVRGDGTPVTGDFGVFGYQERYAEYRYKQTRITGEFQSEHPTSLDVWHLAQEFASLPALNSAFLEENPPIDRVVAVADGPHFLLDVWFNLQCERPMPVYSVPGMIDHF